MSKLTRKSKIEVYEKRKQGESIATLSNAYGVRNEIIKYLV